MRLVTFNILNGRTPPHDRVDIDAFQDAVRRLDADVLALQEVDRNQPRSQGLDLTAVAADVMQAVDHRFVAALSGNPGSTWVAATGEEQPDAASYGIALLSRFPVTAWQVVRLRPAPLPTPLWFKGKVLPSMVRDEPRVAVAASVETPDGPVTIANTHLSFIPWWSWRQLRTLVRALETADRPLLLLGDLNMGPARVRALTRMNGLAAHPTFPAHRPREQIDHVLADGAVHCLGSSATEMGLSDHRALVADVTLG